MAGYNKTSNKTQNKDVKYLNKDYNSFKNKLIEFTKIYFPDSFNDFSEGNPGMMFLEMASYVGDVLSFYTDTQLQESFLSLAQDRENVYNLSYAMGYSPKVSAVSSVDLEVFQVVPAKTLGSGEIVPDYSYALDISPYSTFKSTDGIDFYTTDPVRFDFSSSFEPTHKSIYKYNSSNTLPEYFLLKKKTKAVSGEFKTQNFTIGDAEQYKTLTLFDSNIIEIESIKDSEGNIWYEVPYLAQDTIFDEITNSAASDPTLNAYDYKTPYLLKVKKVPKRFITRVKNNNELEIQFGAGSSGDADVVITPDPNNIGLGIKDGRNKLDVAYDPSNFLFSKAYGEVPSNTTLTVKYLRGGGVEANVNSNTIINLGEVITTPKPNIDANMLNFVRASIAVNNPEPARGGGSGDSLEEVRMNAMAQFSSQNRTVTKSDYLVRTLSMPPRFGRIAKVWITQDDQISPLTNEANRIPNPLALNLYTLGYDGTKKLSKLNTATKTNLRTYLEQQRMLTDAINIKDAFIINFRLEFEITTFKNYNNQEVLLDCITELKDYFKIDKWQINQPIIKSEVENLIAGVLGVQTVEKVELFNVNGELSGYSKYRYDFPSAVKKGVIYPSLDPSIFELKYPDTDIKGRVTTY
tara:strand:- start:551 stop:2452 length:1902 start_codon:yes stop_codon:yes gene_type:complete